MSSQADLQAGAIATPSLKPTLALAFAVFSGGYFLSYTLRAVNAVLAPDLRGELALGSEALGWLTSAYLVTFAAMQLPMGVCLDRFGARKVESVLLLIAGAGCLVFATAHSFWGLFVGRAMIGAGVSVCLMAAFTSFRQWFAPELMPRLAAGMLVVGTSGALVASVPVRLLADASSWRMVFFIAAVAFVVVAGAMWLLLPKHTLVQPTAGAAPAGYGVIFRRQAIWATAPIAFFGQGGFIALQTLWVTPWLMQNLGQSAAQAASTLFLMNLSLLLIYVVIGALGGKLNLARERLMIIGSLAVSALAMGALTLWRAPDSWVLFVVLAVTSTGTILLQSRVSISLPKAIAGRGNVSLNLIIFIGGFLLQGGIGWLAGVFSRGLGLSAADGLAATFALLALCQLGGVAWLWAHWRSAVNFDEA